MTTDDNEPSFFARYIEGPKKERLEPRKILMGKDTVLHWMQTCIDADAIKLEETENPRAIKLGSDHKPAWVAAHYLYKSYLATCRLQGTWYPTNTRLFGRTLTKTLGSSCRSTIVPEDLAIIMFGHRKRPRRPWGYFIPSGAVWQELLAARAVIPKQATPRSRPGAPAGWQRMSCQRLIAKSATTVQDCP